MLHIGKSRTLENLINDCKKGSPKAQRVLYERYSGRFLSICMRYMGKQDVAEDLMISSFMRIFEKIDTYKGEGNFEGWMRRIVVNQCLSELRKQRNMYVAISMEEAVAMPDINLLESHLAAEELLQLVTDLPIGYRTVFNLYAIEGYSHKEIAEQLGINENTSKSQLSRARVHLQQALKKMEEAINVKKESHGEK